jgi:hypothetical protein
LTSSPRLIQVSGDQQGVSPGNVLPQPLVVRLEDQFGSPLRGAPVSAEIIQGAAKFLSPPQVTTDNDGRASFRLQAGPETKSIVTRVTALGQEVRFQSLIIALMRPNAIAVESDGALIVVDNLSALVRVHPVTGALTLVSGLGRGTGPPFFDISGIAVEADGSLIVADSLLGVLRVDPLTGDRTILSR